MATNYENLSSDLIWEITRGSNAFLVKRKASGGVQFSRDPLNLTNKHSRKYEGYANPRAIGINAGPNNTISFATKVEKKQSQPAKSQHNVTFGASTPSRKVYRSIVSSTAKKGYRADLRAEAVARASAIKLSQKEKKATPAAKPRGNKAKKAEESS